MPIIRNFFYNHLTVIDRYFLREFVVNLFAVTGILWLIYLATRFSRYVAQAALGNLPGDVIFTLLGYSSLSVLSLLLPVGAFLAVMLSLGRMNSDNELAVISACGISNLRLIATITLFAGFIAVIVAVLSLVVAPAVLGNDYKLEKQSKMSADTTGLVAGKFKESRNGKWTFYSEKVSEDKQGMDNVFIKINRDKRQRPLIFRADKGHFEIDQLTGNKYLVLDNGYRYEGRAGEKDFTIVQYAEHSLLIEKGDAKRAIVKRYQTLSTHFLWHRGNVRDIAEIQWRCGSVIMTIILCLLAITLVGDGPRKGRYAGFFPAIMIYLLYSNLLGISKAWVAKGTMVPWLGAIWVHLFMFIVFLLLFNRHKIRYYWREKVAR